MILKTENIPTSSLDGVIIQNYDVLYLYDDWESPTIIVSDGPYGVSSFPGDPPTPDKLASWYEPHIKKWTEKSSPATTLWFWNTEIGWANVHPVLEKYGWEYKCCNVWNKGIAHVAGNSNTQILRQFPVVTEVCVQYTKKCYLKDKEGRSIPLKEWLRTEWLRTGLPLSKTNEACDVKNAATRKYFTQCHLWYIPPVEAFEKIVEYANKYGEPNGRPYFSADGIKSISGKEWRQMRAKFYCKAGVTNVWDEPSLRGKERLKTKSKCIHLNQKPLKLLKLIIESSSDEGDVVWEPFGGLCSVAIAAHTLNRKCRSAEIINEYWEIAKKRLKNYDTTFDTLGGKTTGKEESQSILETYRII